MAKVAFILLRVFTAIAALLGLAGIALVIVFTAAVGLLKGGVSMISALTTLVSSGFRSEGATPSSEPLIPLALAGLALAFVAMFYSVFLPKQKTYLHIVAAMTVIFGVWRLWTIAANPESPWFFVPMIAVWFLYYVLCLRRVR